MAAILSQPQCVNTLKAKEGYQRWSQQIISSHNWSKEGRWSSFLRADLNCRDNFNVKEWCRIHRTCFLFFGTIQHTIGKYATVNNSCNNSLREDDFRKHRCYDYYPLLMFEYDNAAPESPLLTAILRTTIHTRCEMTMAQAFVWLLGFTHNSSLRSENCVLHFHKYIAIICITRNMFWKHKSY